MPDPFHALDMGFSARSEAPVEEQITELRDYVCLLLEQLRYTLANLDRSNINENALDAYTGSLNEAAEKYASDYTVKLRDSLRLSVGMSGNTLNVSITADGVTVSDDAVLPQSPSESFRSINQKLGYLYRTYNGSIPSTVTGSYIYSQNLLGGSIYALDAGDSEAGHASMTENGFTISTPVSGGEGEKVTLSVNKIGSTYYPFMKLGVGTDTAAVGAGLIMKLGKGLWIGDDSIKTAGGQCPGGKTYAEDISASFPYATGIFIDLQSDCIYKYVDGCPQEL